MGSATVALLLPLGFPVCIKIHRLVTAASVD